MAHRPMNAIPLLSLQVLILAALLAAACAGSGEAPLLVSQSTAAAAPAIGSPDSLDRADRACTLIMRDLGRRGDEAGEFLTACDDDGCHFVWEGSLEVASEALADGATVAVLYHLQGSGDWWQVEAQPQGPGNPGFVRLGFRIDAHLPGPDLAEADLMAAAIEFIPFVEQADGGRLFDHNRVRGDFENYLARGEQGFYLGLDAAVCNHRPDTAALRFGSDWTAFPIGEPRAGGRLALHYDLARLPDCRQGQDWDLEAFVQVDGNGPLLSGSLVRFTEAGAAYAWPLILDLPADAQTLTVWFRARATDGSCEAYDSDFGQNYTFELNPPRDEGFCAFAERWDDRYGGEAACPDYAVDAEADASYCEFAASGFGDGYEGHYGIPFRWLEAWLWTGATEGEVIAAGMYVAYQDRSDATAGQRWIFGQRADDGSWQTGFNYLFSGYMGAGSYRYAIDHYAFFIDVRRPTGRIERLWQSRAGANYTLADAFSLPTDTVYIPYGRVEWANQQSPVFDALRACR